MYLPTTQQEMRKLGWNKCDVILITGDTYIDHPFTGAALLGKLLLKNGYRTGIIAQPDIHSSDIARLGEPELFWGVTAGSMDSMAANYTAVKKWRKSDDLTPGGMNNRRPDRASIVYANLVRRYFKPTVPIVLGGIEASLRRIAHYDYWTDKIRKSILFNAKADYLIYGMAEQSVLELCERLVNNQTVLDVNGLCYIGKEKPENYIELPSFETVRDSADEFIRMFQVFYQNHNSPEAAGLAQKQDDRYLIHNPPCKIPETSQLDMIYDMEFERDVHPFYRTGGEVTAMDTIPFSIASHRGCCGECHFCSIGVHQGSQVYSRSDESILKEARRIASHKNFKGIIHDVGGPTANMLGIKCAKNVSVHCADRSCLFPETCKMLKPDHARQIRLLKMLRSLPGVRKVNVQSGIRHDLILADQKSGCSYLEELFKNNISGQLKTAPEHSAPNVLTLMGKPGFEKLLQFKNMFDSIKAKSKLKQFLTYYFIAAHPGCDESAMRELKKMIEKHLKIHPEQVQIFTPLPSTWSAVMYHTGKNPFTGKPVFIEKNTHKKMMQKQIITKKT